MNVFADANGAKHFPMGGNSSIQGGHEVNVRYILFPHFQHWKNRFQISRTLHSAWFFPLYLLVVPFLPGDCGSSWPRPHISSLSRSFSGPKFDFQSFIISIISSIKWIFEIDLAILKHDDSHLHIAISMVFVISYIFHLFCSLESASHPSLCFAKGAPSVTRRALCL